MEVKNETIAFLNSCTGLTGSIASGKSTVAKMLTDRGGHLIDTDLIAREVVEPGMPALDKIHEAFGDRVINDDGSLNREELRHIIIHDSDKRNNLDSIIHPHINEMVLIKLQGFMENDNGMPVFVDVPLLYETGWDRFFHGAVLVYVTEEVQLHRLMERDNLDEKTARATMATQMALEEKKTRAAYVIDNSGTLDETERQVDSLFSELSELWLQSGT